MIKPNWDLYNCILETTDMTATQTWADACRVVFTKTYSIVEGGRLQALAKLEDLAVKYKSLEEKYFQCQLELDQMKQRKKKTSLKKGLSKD